jgi:capsular polysaccharide transport system ATP-binding protein
VIRLENVTKSYLTLRGRKVVFSDLSLDIPEGLNVGLIGRNGAGKSTLMRLLSAVELPDSGRITTKARLSWPVGLSGGMQRNLTGRDNVKFVCRIHGVRRSAMAETIRFVQEFAEIGDYFDHPVSTYSSGMRARLAFGMSMAFDFDYYLIDEIMSVGDASFKEKSRQVFKERLANSKLIIVTHNMKRVLSMCDIVVLLQQGGAVLYENVREGVAAYRAAGGFGDAEAEEAPVVQPARKPRRRPRKRSARRKAGGAK